MGNGGNLAKSTGYKLKRFFMWLLIFPIIFEKLDLLATAQIETTDKVNNALSEGLAGVRGVQGSTMEAVAGLSQMIGAQHNSTYYYNRKGELINLTACKEIGIELNFVPGINGNDSLRVLLSADKKQIDEIEFLLLPTLEKVIQDDDKALFEYIILLLRQRQLDRDSQASEIRNNLINAFKNHYTLSFRQFAGLSVHTLLDVNREVFEKLLKDKTEEYSKKYVLLDDGAGLEAMIGESLIGGAISPSYDIKYESIKPLTNAQKAELYTDILEIIVLEKLSLKLTVEKTIAKINSKIENWNSLNGKDNAETKSEPK